MVVASTQTGVQAVFNIDLSNWLFCHQVVGCAVVVIVYHRISSSCSSKKKNNVCLWTHGFVSDQVVLDGGTTVVLLDPVDFVAVAPVVESGFQLGGAWFPWTGGKTETKSPGRI